MELLLKLFAVICQLVVGEIGRTISCGGSPARIPARLIEDALENWSNSKYRHPSGDVFSSGVVVPAQIEAKAVNILVGSWGVGHSRSNRRRSFNAHQQHYNRTLHPRSLFMYIEQCIVFNPHHVREPLPHISATTTTTTTTARYQSDFYIPYSRYNIK